MSCSFERDATPRRTAISKKLLLSSSALIAALAVSGPAGAQAVTELEGIVVQSANRTPTEASKVGSSVSVITEKEIEAQSKTFLKDYLEQVTGVHLRQNGGPGGTTGISIRGASQQYVKVLVDGMDLSDPVGTQVATHFQHLMVGDISRIEVLKGPQSTLYGGDAVAGVISIETKAATQLGFSQSGGAEYGRYNTYRGSYTAGYRAQSGSNIALSVQGFDSDGFSATTHDNEDDGYRNLTISGRGEVFITEDVSIFFAARTLDARNQYDQDDNPFIHGDTVQHAGRIGTNINLLDGRFQNTFAVQGMKIMRDDLEPNPPPPGPWGGRGSTSWFDGDRIKTEYKGVYTFTDRVATLFGADWERTSAQSLGAWDLAPSDKDSSEIYGFYGQLMVEPIDGLLLTGGGRTDEHSEFGQFNTYRLTAAYNIPGTDTIFRGSYGTGFRAPSLYELYAPSFGNPDLEPETSKGWDVGIEQGFLQGRLKVGATYFSLDTTNHIGFGSVGYEQVLGITERDGVELFAAAQLTPGLTATAGYTYIDSNIESGQRLIRVPKHNVVLGLDAEPLDKVTLNVTANFISGLTDLPQGDPTDLDDYVLLSAKIGYEFAPGWTAYVRGENLLNEDYVTLLTYNTPGLAVYGGLHFALPSN